MAIEDNLTQGVNGFFYITISTLICTSISLLIKYSYKSRCTEIICCCFSIKRDPISENQEDLQNLKLNTDEKI